MQPAPKARTRPPRWPWLALAAQLVTATLLGAPARAGTLRRVTLETAYRLAVKHSPSLEVLDHRVRQAEAARRGAWTPIKPTVGFSGSFTHYDQEIKVDFGDIGIPGVPPMDPVVIQERNQFAFGLQATLPLFRGSAYPNIGVARTRVRLARQQRLRSRRDFLLQIAQAHYGMLGQKEAIKAIENKVRIDRRNVDASKARFAVGKVPRSEVMRADLVLTQDEQALTQQRNALSAARRELGILLGQPGKVDAIRPPETAAPRGSARAMVRRALRGRADYQATQTAVLLRSKAKSAVWWSFLPSLDLSWLYRWQQAAGFANQRGSWQLVFNLNLPIYDGGLRYAQLREARARLAISRAERRAAAQRIERRIVRLRAQLASAEAGLLASRKAVTLARTTAEDMNARYEAGTTIQLEVLDASQRQLEAELSLTRSRLTRELARIALRHAVGEFRPLERRGP